MKKILSAITIVCALASASCTNLDEVVYSSLTQSTYNYSEDDLIPSIIACYTPLRSYFGHGTLWAMDATTTDMIVMPPNSTGWDDGGIYRRMHYHKWNSEQSHIGSAWNTTWKGIGLCNNLLSQLTPETNPFKVSESVLKAAEAEVRALRAYYYWVVVDNWGDAPLVKAVTTELPECTPRKDIYDFIVKELEAVIPSLSETFSGEYYGRMNKWAAEALLARTALNAGVYTGTPDWNKALAACEAIINSHKFDLAPHFRDCFLADQDAITANKEIIFAVPYDHDLATGNYIHQFSWGAPLKAAFGIQSTPWGSGSAMAIPQFVDTFDPADKRIDDNFIHGQQYKYGTTEPIYCIYDTDGTGQKPLLNYQKDIQSGNFTLEWEGYRCNKFETTPETTGNSDTDMPIFRYAEILLMKAECLLRLGQKGAGDLVTQVRNRDFDDPEKAKVTDDQLKENSSYKYGYYAADYGTSITPGDQSPIEFGRLYDEYRWELVWEYGLRTHSIRFGAFTTKNWLSHEALGAYTSLFPIPKDAITSNPKLTQNPNYE